MKYKNQDFWEIIVELASLPSEPVFILLPVKDGRWQVLFMNGEMTGNIQISSKHDDMQIFDTWNHAGEYENAFYTSPFQEIFCHRNQKNQEEKLPKSIPIYLK